MYLSETKMETITKAVAEFGGATVDAHGSLVMFSDGYMVSKPGEVVLPSIHSDELRDHAESYMEDTPLGDGEYYGFWVHGGALYSDVSVWIPNRDDAMSLAKKNNQIAIFDWATYGEVFVP